MADEDVLSQDEIDALAKVAKEDTVSKVEEKGAASLYDFHQPVHILKARLPAVEIINDRFAKIFESTLNTYISRPFELHREDVEMVKFGDYVVSLPIITNTSRAKVSPLSGSMLVIATTELVFIVVESFFGGTNEKFLTEEREFTQTERRVAQRLTHDILQDYTSAWSSISPLQFEYISNESRSQTLNFVDSADIVVVNKFIIEILEQKAELHIVIPFSVLEPIKPILVSGIQREKVTTDEYWYKLLQEKVYESNVELRAVMSEADVSLNDLLNMKKGDFIPLRMHETCIVYADEYPVFEGKVGVSNQSAAVKILNWKRKH